MTLLDTIPVYRTPPWLIVLFILSAAAMILGLCIHDEDWAPFVALAGLILFFIVIGLNHIDSIKVFDHDEYVIELHDISASEFYFQYEPIQTYEYSDAIRVKKRDDVK